MLEDKEDKYLQFLQLSGNFLIVKDSMGKAKPTTRALPGQSHIYGLKPKPDVEGVGSLLSSWSEHKSSSLPRSDKDFKKLNALCLTQKACTAPEQRAFRQYSDIRVKTASQRSQIIVPDMIFGMSAKPSTPIKAVLGNFYGELAADLNRTNYSPKSQRKASSSRKSTLSFDRRNNYIRSSLQSSPKHEFKLKKFLSVEPRTITRRNK